MEKIDWRARLFGVLAFYLIDQAHVEFFGHPENTKMSVTIYLATAALANVAVVVVAAKVLRDQLSYDIQRLNYCAIIVNFMGWLAYLASKSPVVFNATITALGYGQFLRLFWIGDDDSDRNGLDLVRGRYFFNAGLHTKGSK